MSTLLRDRLFLLIIPAVFFISGGASLVYQVVWQRALTLHYGVGPISTTIVVTVFLFGLGLGSLLGGILAERVRGLLYAYLVLELVLGVIGYFSLDALRAAIPLLSGTGYVRGLFVVAALLSIPTLLMGMTLPLVIKITNAVARNLPATISLLYFLNTLGAACGALFAAYYLISFYGLERSVEVAALGNLGLGVMVVAAVLIRPPSAGEPSGQETPLPEGGATPAGARWALVAVLVTGFIAIGYQMIWFRVTGVLIKVSPYVFPTVLFVYLLGIALGSWWMNLAIRRNPSLNLRKWFLLVNLGIAVYTVASVLCFYYGTQFTPFGWLVETSFAENLHPPYHPVHAIKGETPAETAASWYLALDILIWPLFFVLVPTILMGASFPLISTLAISDRQHEGWGVGRVYAVNIAGNVLGGLVTGFILLPLVGTEWVMILFGAVGLVWGGLLLAGRSRTVKSAGLLVALIGLALLPGRDRLYRVMHPPPTSGELLIDEGVDGVVASYAYAGRRSASVYINGMPHATYPGAAYFVEVVEAITWAPEVSDILVIGYGGGTIADLLLKVDGVESVTVVEISETLLRNLGRIDFYPEIWSDPRLEFIIDDGRRFLQNTDTRYDAIFMDPLRSTSAYSNNLCSKEFFELAAGRLKPDGLMFLWMNEYTIIPKTFAAVLDDVRVYYYFCLGTNGRFEHSPARREHLMAQIDDGMKQAMSRRMDRPYYYRGDRAYIDERGAGYPINTDFEPISEYYIGMNLRRHRGTLIAR